MAQGLVEIAVFIRILQLYRMGKPLKRIVELTQGIESTGDIVHTSHVPGVSSDPMQVVVDGQLQLSGSPSTYLVSSA